MIVQSTFITTDYLITLRLLHISAQPAAILATYHETSFYVSVGMYTTIREMRFNMWFNFIHTICSSPRAIPVRNGCSCLEMPLVTFIDLVTAKLLMSHQFYPLNKMKDQWIFLFPKCKVSWGFAPSVSSDVNTSRKFTAWFSLLANWDEAMTWAATPASIFVLFYVALGLYRERQQTSS